MNPGEDRPQGSVVPGSGAPSVADESTNTVAIGARATAVADSSSELSSMGTVITSGPPQSTAAVPPTPAAAEPPARRDAEFEDASPKQLDLTGRTIGGYKVTRMLGAGGMGAVCLAHQVSLDRDVALKILPAKMAKNPDFLMRFMREGLSAARMTHHNIIQIYDIGDADNIHYISLEYVRGQTMGQILRDQKRLDANTAAGYILQAARGLEYAHRRGIIHRDIKPDNLMLNEHGIVKIADMGLAKMLNEAKRGGAAPAPAAAPAGGTPEIAEALKTATGDLTMGDIAMGTPSYMPPEQARDASSVDHRADQYSLGCTFYALLVGHAPFTGGSAYELIHKHLIDPPPPLEELAPETPIDIIRIIYRMLAKEPDDRFPDMTAVIAELENFMGGHGARIPNQSHVKTLEQALADYYAPAATRRRKAAMIVFSGGVPALAFVVYWIALLGTAEEPNYVVSWAIGVLGLTPVCKFLHEGVREKTYFFRRFKNFVLTMSLKEWAAALFAGLVAVRIFGGPVIFLVSLVCSAALAVAYDVVVKSRIRWQHSRPIEEMNRMMKELRIGGLGENQIEGFVAGYSGDNWEEFYEALFGYEAMIQARERLLESAKGKPRKVAAAWRDPLVRLLDKAEAARKSKREKKQLSKVEAQRLQSAGVAKAEAKKKADEMASMLVNRANIQAEQQLIYVPASSLQIEKAGQTKRDQTLLPAVKPAQATPLPGARTKRRNSVGIDQAARFFLGLALCVAFGLPAGMKEMLPDAIFAWSQGTWALALITGVMLMISTFSGRKLWGLILLSGGVLFTLHVPLREFVPQDPLGISLLMIAGGFVLPWLSKLTGKEY